MVEVVGTYQEPRNNQKGKTVKVGKKQKPQWGRVVPTRHRKWVPSGETDARDLHGEKKGNERVQLLLRTWDWIWHTVKIIRGVRANRKGMHERKGGSKTLKRKPRGNPALTLSDRKEKSWKSRGSPFMRLLETKKKRSPVDKCTPVQPNWVVGRLHEHVTEPRKENDRPSITKKHPTEGGKKSIQK